jgi:hypothetical protein
MGLTYQLTVTCDKCGQTFTGQGDPGAAMRPPVKATPAVLDEKGLEVSPAIPAALPRAVFYRATFAEKPEQLLCPECAGDCAATGEVWSLTRSDA